MIVTAFVHATSKIIINIIIIIIIIITIIITITITITITIIIIDPCRCQMSFCRLPSTPSMMLCSASLSVKMGLASPQAEAFVLVQRGCAYGKVLGSSWGKFKTVGVCVCIYIYI